MSAMTFHRFLFGIGAALMLLQSAVAQPLPEKPVVIIGTTNESLSPQERQAVMQTFLYLSAKLPQYSFTVRSYPVSKLEIAVKNGEIDLFLASSGFYRRVFHRGLRDLVTMTTTMAEDPNYASGAVFLVRNESPVRTLADLKGKTAAISWREGFTGYFVPMLALAEEGLDEEHFFHNYVIGGSPMKKLLEAVKAGQADVAFARACTFEELMQAEPVFASQFRPVGLKTEPVSGFHCLRSTPLFPNWTIVSTSRAPWQLSRDVTKTLLSMPRLENGTAWAVVSDFARVDDLYRKLKRGPYEYLRIRSISDFLQAYWPALGLLILLVAGLALHSWRTGILIRKRTRELQDAMERERRASAAATEERRQKEVLEQVSIIGAMSSLITHELNAPLSGISNSVRSLERLFEQSPPPPLAVKALELIHRQCDHAADIVQHVRSYAKRREIVHSDVNMARIVASVSRDQQIKHPAVTFVTAICSDSVHVRADPLELELCITNIVKNAVDALKDVSDKVVEISLDEEEAHAVLTVRDHGAGTCADAEGLFCRSLNSTKQNGLGLGLMIVRTIVERTAGNITAAYANPGIAITLRIPSARSSSKDDVK